MNNTLRNILIVGLVAVLGVGLFVGGMFFGSSCFGSGPYGMMNYGYSGYNNSPANGNAGYGPGMMFAPGASTGAGNGNYGPGMMGAGVGNGGYGPGMMGGGLVNAQPITVDQTQKAVEAYLAQTGDADLELQEIMTFDNGGYAIVKEKSTGIGAFELLIDPISLVAYPEYGPNMMWNLKYGMMSGIGNYGGMMGGGMMGRWNSNSAPSSNSVSAEMPVSAEQAAEYAQKYLDTALPGVKVSDEISPFYGYYTIDLQRDGKIIGMLSVNGYSGQVFPHTWHGQFIEMDEYNSGS